MANSAGCRQRSVVGGCEGVDDEGDVDDGGDRGNRGNIDKRTTEVRTWLTTEVG